MKRIFTIASVILSAVATAQSGQRTTANFTANNLVVYRVGDGSAALSSAATAVFLDEYTPAGTLVQSIALPTAVNGSNKRITASGSATSEGGLTRSGNGLYLVASGYDAATGTASVAGTAGSSTSRVIGRIDYTGAIDATTALSDFSDGNNPRCAYTYDGTAFWGVGGAGGVRYATLGSATSTQISSTLTNIRSVGAAGGQLYISTSSGSAVRIGAVGTGLPNTTGQTIVTLPGLPVSGGSPYAFYFADLSATVAGPDVLYIADDGSGTGIQKYSLVAGSWVANGNIAVTGNATRGLTGSVSGSNVTLYTTNGTSIYSLLDNSGYNTTIAGTPTLVATAATNTAIRGIALAPTATATPLNLLSLNAAIDGKHVNVWWSTINEVNVQGFAIERSIDGKNFTVTGNIAAKNTASHNNYAFTDANAAPTEKAYYRLKMVDKDGSFKYSNIIVLNQKVNSSISVYPNPAVNSISISHTKAEQGTKAIITSVEGRTVASYNLQTGATVSNIDVSSLTNGNYILTIVSANGKQVTKFIKY